PEGCERSCRADQGQCLEAVQARRLIVLLLRLNQPARTANPGFFVGLLRRRWKAGWPASVAPNHIAAAISRPCQSRALHLVSARFGPPLPAADAGCSCSSVG